MNMKPGKKLLPTLKLPESSKDLISSPSLLRNFGKSAKPSEPRGKKSSKKKGSLEVNPRKKPPSFDKPNKDQLFYLSDPSKSSPKAWDEDYNMSKYLGLIQENDEKVKLSYELLIHKAALEFNSGHKDTISTLENTQKREKKFHECNKAVFEFSENKDFMKSFSEKRIEMESYGNLKDIPCGLESKETKTAQETQRPLKKVDRVEVVGNFINDLGKEIGGRGIEMKDNCFAGKSKQSINELKGGPLILTKAESYLRKQIQKNSSKSPKNAQSSRIMSLEKKTGLKTEIASPKPVGSLSEVYKNLDGISVNKRSLVVKSPKELSGSNDFLSFPNSPAYSRVVSFRNYLNNKL